MDMRHTCIISIQFFLSSDKLLIGFSIQQTISLSRISEFHLYHPALAVRIAVYKLGVGVKLFVLFLD